MILDGLGFNVISCLHKYFNYIRVKLSIFVEPPVTPWKHHFMHLLQTRDEWFAIIGKFLFHIVKYALRYPAGFSICEKTNFQHSEKDAKTFIRP